VPDRQNCGAVLGALLVASQREPDAVDGAAAVMAGDMQERCAGAVNQSRSPADSRVA